MVWATSSTRPREFTLTTISLVVNGLIPFVALLFRRVRRSETAQGLLALYRREHVGFVMQNFSLIPYLTALGNVTVPMGFLRVPAAEREERGRTLLREVGLVDRANHLPRELSAGQQQRVAIARAMANRPALVLADEPTGNLDPALSRDILDLLAAVNREKRTTIVMVTHSPEAAARGDLRVRLEAGRVVKVERPAAAALSASR